MDQLFARFYVIFSIRPHTTDEECLNCFGEELYRETVSWKQRHHLIIATIELDLLLGFIKSEDNIKQLPLYMYFILMTGTKRKRLQKDFFQQEDASYPLLRKVFSLSLLPHEDIPSAFEKLREMANNEEVQTF
ncbi:hypothetical protein ACF0H5_014721 [Mactra antiquata]